MYRAEHVRLRRSVALKLLLPELGGDERFRERFLRESRLAAATEHPGILPIYDAGEGWPVGTPGVETTISSTVERLDLTSPAAVRETITLPRPASELDVDGTRIFYRGLEDDSPIYELSGATWTPRQPQLENP